MEVERIEGNFYQYNNNVSEETLRYHTLTCKSYAFLQGVGLELEAKETISDVPVVASVAFVS